MQALKRAKLVVSLSLITIGSAQAFSHPTPQVTAITWQDAGLMQGFPPLESQQVTKANMGKYPYVSLDLTKCQ